MEGRLLTLMAFALVITLGLTFVAGVGNVSAWGGKKVDITGKVEQGGKIVADNGKEYTITDNSKGKELMSGHMCHQVEVKGTVTSKNGQDMLRISSFKHLAEGTC